MNVWSQPGYLVYSMELADGSLLDFLEAHQEALGTAVPPEQICGYLGQAATALDFLNTRTHLIEGQRVGVQHCDVKPSNLLLFGETVKLGDFGLVTLTTARLQAHERVGTPSYAGPEVFHGQLSDQSDQYSLAVTYCVLRCGRLPFPGADTFDTNWLMRRPLPDLAGMSATEQSVIERALQPVPQERWSSCCELMNQLTGAIS
jgi:serine/threonine protein kinase